jgi:hypothetical protein
MPTDAEVIAQAQALLYDNIYPYMKTVKEYEDIPKDTLLTFCAWQTEVLEQLLPIAEKWRAMLLDREFKDVFSKLPNGTTYSISGLEKQAMKNLDMESTSWRKIGPEEVAAIHRAILGMTDPNFHHSSTEKEAVKVLRRLISLEDGT